ncbi:hypothetical protein SAMN05216597_0112 [Pseudomonas cannabina]|nr:hypothetical protein SAMN05216597_0112 [Pseudomonas cannabina]
MSIGTPCTLLVPAGNLPHARYSPPRAFMSMHG